MLRIVIDQSTSGSKGLLFKGRKIVDRVDRKHQQIYPKNDWVEHNPIEIVSNVKFVIDQLLNQNSLSPNQIESISITNQRETVVAWNRSSGQPLYNAIVWQCARTSEYCNKLAIHNPIINKITGLRVDNYFSAPKYNWILNNVEEAKQLAKEEQLCLGTIESWLIYNLSDEKNHYSDITNASRTLLMNIMTNSWSEEMLKLFEIPRSALPQIKLPNQNYGTYLGIPIIGVIADSQGALVAHKLSPNVEAKITMGTGSSIMVNVGTENKLRNTKVLTAVYGNKESNLYAIEAIIKSFGDTIEFVKNNLNCFEDYDQIFEYAFSEVSDKDVIFIPGQFGLGSPYWKDGVGCQVLNLSRSSNSNDIGSAAIRSLIYQIVVALDEIERTTGQVIEVLKVDGGLIKQHKFLQHLSDLSQKKVVVAEVEEASAFGAVSGLIDNGEEQNHLVRIDPNIVDRKLYDKWLQTVKIFLDNLE